MKQFLLRKRKVKQDHCLFCRKWNDISRNLKIEMRWCFFCQSLSVNMYKPHFLRLLSNIFIREWLHFQNVSFFSSKLIYLKRKYLERMFFKITFMVVIFQYLFTSIWSNIVIGIKTSTFLKAKHWAFSLSRNLFVCFWGTYLFSTLPFFNPND